MRCKSTTDPNGSSKNEESACLIPELLAQLDQYEQVKGYSIGVITGYTAQLRLIKSKIRAQLTNTPRGKKNHHKSEVHVLKNIAISELAVSVVDRFQGLEKDIVILDLVRSNVGTLGFLANANRINVALSRHKKLLIIVGNYNWLVRAKAPGKENRTRQSVPLQQYLRALDNQSIVKNVQDLF